jgi:tetratricopeptide (TPR) repeat protein
MFCSTVSANNGKQFMLTYFNLLSNSIGVCEHPMGSMKLRLSCKSVLKLVMVASALYYNIADAAGQGNSGHLLTIKTEPNASVWLNGVLYGKTDAAGQFTIRSVPAGVQKVRIRASGFKEVTKPVTTGSMQISLAKTTDEAELAFQEAERLAGVDRAKAAEAFRRVIKLKPTFVDAYIGLARTLSDAGDFEGANSAIKSAIKVAPRNAEAAAVDGRIQRLSGDDAKAIAAFKRSITLGVGFQPEAYTGLAMLFQDHAEAAGADGDMAGETKNYEEAAKNFSVAVKQLGTGVDAPTIYQLLGLVYERQKKYKEAIALYQTFLRLFPDSAEASAVESFIVQLKKQMEELNEL